MNTEIIKAEFSENTLKSEIRTMFEGEDMSLVGIDNPNDIEDSWPTEVRKSRIHFYFCIEGKAAFEFGPHYNREIQQQKNYFFYNPEKDLPFVLKIAPKTRMIILSISL